MRLKWLMVFIAGCCFTFNVALAEHLPLKERFLKRKPIIERFKNQGRVGENNVGKLVIRGHLNEEEIEIVHAENADREIVYVRIAEKLKISPLVVGKRRAIQIARTAKKGHWLQHPDGHWYRKKSNPD
jgi:uncharacterized protein YdbL (DUF1318 family)